MNILITGGRSDMGLAMAETYLGLGHQVWVTSSDDKGTSELKTKFKGKKIKAFTFDLARPEATGEDISRLKLDGLVLNAATAVRELKYFHQFEAREMKDELERNIYGNLWLLKEVLPGMQERKFGRIVLISSVAAATGPSMYSLYCLSKSAMEGLFLNLAVDYAKDNILSNILRPGIIKTERTRRFWEREYYQERVGKKIPQGRMGNPMDVARATLPFLEEDSYINGAVLNVSGGLPLIKSKGI